MCGSVGPCHPRAGPVGVAGLWCLPSLGWWAPLESDLLAGRFESLSLITCPAHQHATAAQGPKRRDCCGRFGTGQGRHTQAPSERAGAVLGHTVPGSHSGLSRCHRCVLGNTTILAEFAGEEEVNRFLAQGQALPPTSSWQPSGGAGQPRLGASGSSHGLVRGDAAHWSAACLGSKGSSELLWGGAPQYSSSLWGPPSTDDSRVVGSPTPLSTLLPGDLLSGESM